MVGIYIILWIIIFCFIYINNDSILIKDDQYYLNILYFYILIFL